MSLHDLPLTDEPQTAEPQTKRVTSPERADQTNVQSEEMEFSRYELPLTGETQELLSAETGEEMEDLLDRDTIVVQMSEHDDSILSDENECSLNIP